MKKQTKELLVNIRVLIVMSGILLGLLLLFFGSAYFIYKAVDKEICLKEVAKSECVNRNLTYGSTVIDSFTCDNITRESKQVTKLNFIEADYKACEQ